MAENSALRSLNPIGVVKEVADLAGIGELAQAGIRWVKLEAFRSTVGRTWFADLFSIFEDPEALTGISNPKAVTYSPANIAHVFYETMRKGIEFSAIAGDDLGSESIGEMLSEGLSSAMESNYNAALQTILNVWKGSLPPDVSVAQALGLRADTVEKLYATSILAPTSALPYTILEALVEGANQRIQQLYSPIDQRLLSLVETKNEYLTAHVRALGEFVANIINELLFDTQFFAERIEAHVNNVVNVIMERITARLDDLEALEARHNTTDPSTGSPMVDDETYSSMLAEIDADVSALENTFNQLKSEVDAMINDYASELSNLADSIATEIVNWLGTLEDMINEIASSEIDAANDLTVVDDIRAKIKEIYERIRAYRQSGFDYV